MAEKEKASLPVKPSERSFARWDPFEMFEAMQDEMTRFWNQPWPLLPRRMPRPLAETKAWAPRMDVFEKNGDLVIKAELPGVKKEDIQVTLDQGELEIKGERKSESEAKEETYYRMERSYGSFYRRLPLPFEAKPDQIKANYADGVLEIDIPKPAEAKPQPKTISVR